MVLNMTVDRTQLLSTREAARVLGITRSAVARLVLRGRLQPAFTLPGKTGAHLFDRATVEALAAERARALNEAA